jgi:hypothetical protein
MNSTSLAAFEITAFDRLLSRTFVNSLLCSGLLVPEMLGHLPSQRFLVNNFSRSPGQVNASPRALV